MGASPLRLPPPADGSAAKPAVAAGAAGASASASAALSALAAVAAAKAAQEAQEADEVRAERRWGPVLQVTVARASLALVVSLLFWSLVPLLAGWTPRVIL